MARSTIVYDIYKIVKENGEVIKQDKEVVSGIYKMADCIIEELAFNRFILKTQSLNIEYESGATGAVGVTQEEKRLLSKLEDRLKKTLDKKQKERTDYMEQNKIELIGKIEKVDNEGNYDYYEYGDIVDTKYRISLSELLLRNEGRKAKITIEFE